MYRYRPTLPCYWITVVLALSTSKWFLYHVVMACPTDETSEGAQVDRPVSDPE